MRSAVATLYLVAAAASFIAQLHFALSVNEGDALWSRLGVVVTVEGQRLLVEPACMAAVGVVLEILIRLGHALGGETRKRELGEFSWRSPLSRFLLAIGIAAYVLSVFDFAGISQSDLGWMPAQLVHYFLRPSFVLGWAACLEYLWRLANALMSPTQSDNAWRNRIGLFLLVLACAVYLVTAPFYFDAVTHVGSHGYAAAAYNVHLYELAWLTGPVTLIGWAGVVEYLSRIATALPTRLANPA